VAFARVPAAVPHGRIPAALSAFFRVADAWELSEIQQCKLLRCPSSAVLRRYRVGQGPRLTPAQQLSQRLSRSRSPTRSALMM